MHCVNFWLLSKLWGEATTVLKAIRATMSRRSNDRRQSLELVKGEIDTNKRVFVIFTEDRFLDM
jgi:hypothetical protein